ncbi:MAG: hypothetical protein GXP46_04280 [Deferribacteres bacterium]|nr:hypothetical protein [Deferribacteres bacterium]
MDMGDDVEPEIGPGSRADEIMRMYPETTDFFVDLGICSCGFDGKFGKMAMQKTLEEIARDKGIPLEEILKKVRDLTED